MYKVVITSDAADKSLQPIAEEKLKGFAELVYDPCPSKDEAELVAKCKDADAVLAMMEPFTENVLAQLPKLKMISVLSIGFNWVDTAAAEKYGVAVTNNPTFCTDEVADHTVALALASARRLLQFSEGVQKDLKWDYYAQAGKVFRLSSQVYGLVGFGRIAKMVAERMKGFGCELIAYDPFITQEQADPYGVTMVPLEEVCARANILSLHCPLMPATEKMINREMFDLMAPHAPILINTGRGGLVDEDAFYEALCVGKVGFACIDDFVKQAPDPATDIKRFVDLDNCLITPHVGFYSTDSVVDQSRMAVDHILDFFSGRTDGLPFQNGVHTLAK